MCDTCKSEGDHRDQLKIYPMGTTVVLLQTIPSGDKRLPIGAVGNVTGHCDDGRAIVVFSDHPKVGHTFHFPETHLAIAFPDQAKIETNDHALL